jgi:flavodoxin
MKTLVIYYSRTGITKQIGDIIAKKLGADVEEIKDTVDRSGAKGYLLSGRDAMKKKLTRLEPLAKNPSDYDLAIIGTPVWCWNMSVPVRTYVSENKDKFSKVAYFCTMGGAGDQKTFSGTEEIIGKKPISTLTLTTKEVVKNEFSKKIEKFLSEIMV